jgi:hypothetical protein
MTLMEPLQIAAQIAEDASRMLARRGRGILGTRERRADRLVSRFVARALNVPPGGVLPAPIRRELETRIDHIVDALDIYIGRGGRRTPRRTMRDSGIVQHIYALREAQQIITTTQRTR